MRYTVHGTLLVVFATAPVVLVILGLVFISWGWDAKLIRNCFQGAYGICMYGGVYVFLRECNIQNLRTEALIAHAYGCAFEQWLNTFPQAEQQAMLEKMVDDSAYYDSVVSMIMHAKEVYVQVKILQTAQGVLHIVDVHSDNEYVHHERTVWGMEHYQLGRADTSCSSQHTYILKAGTLDPNKECNHNYI